MHIAQGPGGKLLPIYKYEWAEDTYLEKKTCNYVNKCSICFDSMKERDYYLFTNMNEMKVHI